MLESGCEYSEIGKSRELSSEKRAQIKILSEQKYSHTKIATKLNISQSTVTRALARIKETGDFKSRKRSGRPRCPTSAADSLIRRTSMAHPTWSSRQIALEILPMPSARTVRKRLTDEFKLPSWKPAKKSNLSKKNIKDRIAFCKKYKEWTAEDWKKVLFSDEATFSQFSSYVRHVRRPINKRYDNRYVVPVVKQSPTVMVWASFCAQGRAGIWFMPKAQP